MKKREDRLLIASLRYFLKINDLKDVPYVHNKKKTGDGRRQSQRRQFETALYKLM